MLVGFLGVGGTGKSTTLSLMGDLGLPRLESVARWVFAKHRLTEKDLLEQPVEKCLKVQREIFEAKLKADDTFHHGITERILCLLDGKVRVGPTRTPDLPGHGRSARTSVGGRGLGRRNGSTKVPLSSIALLFGRVVRKCTLSSESGEDAWSRQEGKVFARV